MKYRLLDYLICPNCKGELSIQSFGEKKIKCAGGTTETEIVEGLLICRCGRLYPIIDCIARFLPEDVVKELVNRYPNFYQKNFKAFADSLNIDKDTLDKLAEIRSKTIDKFGYEWTEFSNYNADNFLELVYPFKSDFFSGKIGLDAGCGAGRHAKQVASYGGEVIGIDLSWAVQAAYKNNAENPKIHIIQADITWLPLKPMSFDFIYSLGVIHHTSDPPASFSVLVPLLKPGGSIMIWVYSDTRKKLLFLLKMTRKLTTRLPNRITKLLAFMAAIVDYGFFIKPYKIFSSYSILRKFLDNLVPYRIKGYAKYDFRVSYTDWFDRLSYPVVNYYNRSEIEKWYENNGLVDIAITPTGLHAWRGLGRAKVKTTDNDLTCAQGLYHSQC